MYIPPKSTDVEGIAKGTDEQRKFGTEHCDVESAIEYFPCYKRLEKPTVIDTT